MTVQISLGNCRPISEHCELSRGQHYQTRSANMATIHRNYRMETTHIQNQPTINYVFTQRC